MKRRSATDPPSPFSGPANWLGPGLVLLCLVAVAGQVRGRPGPDVAWNLYAAGALLDGGRLGVDVLENTPPMIFVLKAPAIIVARALQVEPWAVWSVAVAMLAVLVVAASALLCRPLAGTRWSLPVWMGVMLTVLLVLPAEDFGQRDHVTALLLLPYLAVTARRWDDGAEVHPFTAIAAGTLAAAGVGIKPFFALVPLAVLLVSRVRRRSTTLPPEFLAIIAAGATYFAGTVMFAPEYLAYARTWGPLYQHFLRLSPVEMLLGGAGVLPGLVAIGLWVAVRHDLGREGQSLASVMIVAVVALELAAILQGKGWRYHFLPATLVAVLFSIAALAWTVKRARRVTARAFVAVAAGTVAATAAQVLPGVVLRAVDPVDPRLDADPNLVRLLPVVRRLGPGEHLAVLSSNILSSFPLVSEAGVRWALRFPNLWPLAAFYENEVLTGVVFREQGFPGSAVAKTRPWDVRSDLERRFGQGVVEDLKATRPGLVLVLTPAPKRTDWGGARRFDYLSYFAEVPDFRDKVLPMYEPVGAIGSYQVLRRKNLAGVIGPLHAAQEQPRDAPWHWPLGRLASLAGGTALLFGGLTAWWASRPRAHEELEGREVEGPGGG